MMRMKEIISRQPAGRYASRPTIQDKKRGSTIHSVNLSDPKMIFYFTLFEKEEAQEYISMIGKSISLEKIDCRIPSIVASVAPKLEHNPGDEKSRLTSVFAHIRIK